MPRTKAKPKFNNIGDLEGKADILLSAFLPRSAQTDDGTAMDLDESQLGCESFC